ncbi:hypothetical protein H7X65_00980 [Candidatus Parcubacteria bacterium]|nr:hypothetical protein [Candidatus Parcubacteria bacterium]
MITKNQRINLSRGSLGFMAVFLLLLSYWGIAIAAAITYPATAIISFFVHSSKFRIKKWSIMGVIFFLTSLVIGPPVLLYTAFHRKDDE